MLLVTAVTVLPSAGTPAMVDNENITGVNASDVPQELESSGETTSMTPYYPLLALVPFSGTATAAAAYYIYR